MKKTNKKKRRRWFFREKYPEDLREQVRFFYRRYLEKLKNKDIEIAKSDTSFDINKKAKEVFNHSIDDIRKIYIRCRYGNKKVTKEDVDNIKIYMKTYRKHLLKIWYFYIHDKDSLSYIMV